MKVEPLYGFDEREQGVAEICNHIIRYVNEYISTHDIKTKDMVAGVANGLAAVTYHYGVSEDRPIEMYKDLIISIIDYYPKLPSVGSA